MNLIIKSDPFAELDKAIVLELLHATVSKPPSKKAQAKYHKTEHFKRLKQAAIALYGSCVLCGRPPATRSLTVHHRRYSSLFCEHLLRDITVLCNRCHAKYHKKL